MLFLDHRHYHHDATPRSMKYVPFSVSRARPAPQDADTRGRTPTYVLLSCRPRTRGRHINNCCRSMTIVEPDSVLEDNGRTYHGYKEGSKYLSIPMAWIRGRAR